MLIIRFENKKKIEKIHSPNNDKKNMQVCNNNIWVVIINNHPFTK